MVQPLLFMICLRVHKFASSRAVSSVSDLRLLTSLSAYNVFMIYHKPLYICPHYYERVICCYSCNE